MRVGLCLCCGFAWALQGGEAIAADSATEPVPVSPREVVVLFNGRDLTGLSTWLKDTKGSDPRQVFRVQDGLLHISGDGNGYVATEEEYRDYHLIVEYKWGKRTDGGKYVRNSGILLHATGPDGGAGGTWMSSIECQLAQGCVGDLIAIRGKDAGRRDDPGAVHERGRPRPRQAAAVEEGGEAARSSPSGQLWWSRARPGLQGAARHARQGRRREPAGRVDPGRMPVRRRAGSRSASTAPTVNECHDVFPAAGKILLQSEGFELFVRKFELHPLKK